MTTYIYTRTIREYYKVEAATAEAAKNILENCDDTTDYLDTETMELKNIQPEFEYWGIPNK